jgi:hypothetical protein
MQTFLFGYIDAPSLPEYIEKDMVDQWNNQSGSSAHAIIGHTDEYRNRLCKINGKLEKGHSYNTQIISGSGLLWAQENVSSAIFDVRIAESFDKHEILGCHVDVSRKYSILYPLLTGGPNTETVLYFDRSLGELVLESVTVDNSTQNDYDLLDEIARIRIPERTWMVINARVFHGVEGMTSTRRIFSASLNDISDLKLKHPIYYHS